MKKMKKCQMDCLESILREKIVSLEKERLSALLRRKELITLLGDEYTEVSNLLLQDFNNQIDEVQDLLEFFGFIHEEEV